MDDPYASLGAPIEVDPYASLGSPHLESEEAPTQKVVGSVGTRFARGAQEPLLGLMQAGMNLASNGSPSMQRIASERNQLTRDFLAESDAMAPEGVDWARLGGNVAVTAPLSVLGGEAVPASLALRPLVTSGLQGAVGGSIAGLVTPVRGEDFGAEKLRQIALGGALGGVATPVLGNALSRVLSPRTSSTVRGLLDQGVELTPGQIAGGATKRVEDVAMSVPFVGQAIRDARNRSIESFNRAAINRSLEPIGQQLPANVTGRDAIAYARKALGDSYDALLPQIQFKPDQQFAAEMANITQMTRSGALPADKAAQFEAIVRDRLISKMTPQGNMSGDSFKLAEEGLKKEAKSYLGSADPDQRKLGEALEAVLATTRSTLSRANPAQADALNKINQGYANYALVRRAAAALGADEGNFTPAQLQSAVRASDGSVGKGSFARGDALMQDLSEAGKTIIPSKTPDSGTGERVATMAALGLGGAGAVAAPLLLAKTAAGTLVARAAYSRPGTNVLSALLTKRPAAANALAQLLDDRPTLVGAPLLSAGMAASEQ